MSDKTMADVLAEHHMSHSDWDENQFAVLCHCGAEVSGEDDGEEAYQQEEALYAKHQADILSAAGFGLVADAKADVLAEVAEEWKRRSQTFMDTMEHMTASREYGVDDILRYGAYSAEANTAATKLRVMASKLRRP